MRTFAAKYRIFLPIYQFMNNNNNPTTTASNSNTATAALITAAFCFLIVSLQGLGWLPLPAEFGFFARWFGTAALCFWAYSRKSLTVWILVAMVVGAAIGYDFPKVGIELDVLQKIFMKLIKTVIAPLLFGTLVVGIAGHADMKAVGRMGWKALLYFEVVTTIALFIGLIAINFSQAGKGIVNTKPSTEMVVDFGKPEKVEMKMMVTRDEKTGKETVTADNTGDSTAMAKKAAIARLANMSFKIDTSKNTFAILRNGKALKPKPELQKQEWKEILLHTFPENLAKSIAEGQVLQLVVFSVLFAIALLMVGENHRRPMLNFAHSLSEVMFKFTGLVMYFAPFGVAGAIAATVANPDLGLKVFKNLGLLLGTLYVALIFFVSCVLLPIALYIRVPLRRFWKYASEPVSIAFATSSSEAALPAALSAMKRFGVSDKVVSFIIPTGMSFNLDGTTLYLALAGIFVAQAANVPMTLGEQILMLLTLMLTSKGVAGVSRASLVILLGTAASFNLPEWPIAAIMGIDALMDMARTSVNMLGNCLATVVVAKWEGEEIAEFDPE